jgi:cytochrome bd-type quinol oxidase subunit 2
MLHTVWFVIIAFFWTGFFVLEGFDFGVGVLHTIVGRSDTERRIAVNAIGPFWDGNEVWLIIAGASTFAAFPGWYATMFSSLYLALLLILAALMARGVSFEYRGKLEDPRWGAGWTWALTLGSALTPLLLGVGLGDLLVGLPINQSHDFTGNFFDLLTGYGIFTGLTLLGLSVLHGATFLSLKTTGAVRERSRHVALRFGWAAIALVIAFTIWTQLLHTTRIVPDPLESLAIVAVIAAVWLMSLGYEGFAFAASALAMGSTLAVLFSELYPKVMVSSTNAAYSLTASNTSSGHYALTVMTIVAAIFVPLIVLYQGWSYHVFRARVGGPRTPGAPEPAAGTDAGTGASAADLATP